MQAAIVITMCVLVVRGAQWLVQRGCLDGG